MGCTHPNVKLWITFVPTKSAKCHIRPAVRAEDNLGGRRGGCHADGNGQRRPERRSTALFETRDNTCELPVTDGQTDTQARLEQVPVCVDQLHT